MADFRSKSAIPRWLRIGLLEIYGGRTEHAEIRDCYGLFLLVGIGINAYCRSALETLPAGQPPPMPVKPGPPVFPMFPALPNSTKRCISRPTRSYPLGNENRTHIFSVSPSGKARTA